MSRRSPGEVARFGRDEFAAGVLASCRGYLVHGQDDLELMSIEMEIEDGWGTRDPAFWSGWLRAIWGPRGFELGPAERSSIERDVVVAGRSRRAEVFGGRSTVFFVENARELANPPMPSVTELAAYRGFQWLVGRRLGVVSTVSGFVKLLEEGPEDVDEALAVAMASQP